MMGCRITEPHAMELYAQGFEIYLAWNSGFWVRTDNMTEDQWTFKVYRTGYEQERIPDHAFPHPFTQEEMAQLYATR